MSKLFSVTNMTKEGLLKKFTIIFLVIFVGTILFILYTPEFEITELSTAALIALFVGLIPGVILAFIWEFFST